MSIKQMSLSGAKQLSNAEMSKLVGGVAPVGSCNCNSGDDCSSSAPKCGNSCGGKTGDKFQGVCQSS
jgi:hypothetical protein